MEDGIYQHSYLIQGSGIPMEKNPTISVGCVYTIGYADIGCIA